MSSVRTPALAAVSPVFCTWRRAIPALSVLLLSISLHDHATPLEKIENILLPVLRPRITRWQEQVKLLDGRVITITQQRRYGGVKGSPDSIPREFWITLTLPETGNQETTWNQKLQPTHVNVVDGKVYIVGFPKTGREFVLYNHPRPPWIGYVFDAGNWHQIPFADIPVALYENNMSLSILLETQRSGMVTLADKEKQFANPGTGRIYKRIDPDYIDKDDPYYTKRNSHLYPPANSNKPPKPSPQPATPENQRN